MICVTIPLPYYHLPTLINNDIESSIIKSTFKNTRGAKFIGNVDPIYYMDMHLSGTVKRSMVRALPNGATYLAKSLWCNMHCCDEFLLCDNRWYGSQLVLLFFELAL